MRPTFKLRMARLNGLFRSCHLRIRSNFPFMPELFNLVSMFWLFGAETATRGKNWLATPLRCNSPTKLHPPAAPIRRTFQGLAQVWASFLSASRAVCPLCEISMYGFPFARRVSFPSMVPRPLFVPAYPGTVPKQHVYSLTNIPRLAFVPFLSRRGV